MYNNNYMFWPASNVLWPIQFVFVRVALSLCHNRLVFPLLNFPLIPGKVGWRGVFSPVVLQPLCGLLRHATFVPNILT